MSLVDIPLPNAEDQFMDPATKQYIDSSLALSEVQSDAKLADFRAIVESFMAQQKARDLAAQREADIRIHADDARFERIEKRSDSIEAGISSLKRFVVATGLSTVLGVAAFNAALLQNMQTAFESGRLLSAVQADVVRQVRETDARQADLMRQMREVDTRVGATSAALTALQAQLAELNTLARERLANERAAKPR